MKKQIKIFTKFNGEMMDAFEIRINTFLASFECEWEIINVSMTESYGDGWSISVIVYYEYR